MSIQNWLKKMAREYWWAMIGFTIIMVVIMVGGYFWWNRHKVEESTETLVMKQASEVRLLDQKALTVDIKGAVKQPGVYELKAGSRVQDVIMKSGGLLEQADTSYINLSKLLDDQMVVIIYTKEEIAAMKKGQENVVIVEGTCICPNVTNDGCLKDDQVVSNQKETTSKKQIELVNINTASIEALQTLTGIGPSKAQDILNYRNQVGKFQKPEDIMNVKGIGKGSYEKIKDHITVS